MVCMVVGTAEAEAVLLLQLSFVEDAGGVDLLLQLSLVEEAAGRVTVAAGGATTEDEAEGTGTMTALETEVGSGADGTTALVAT